MIEPLDIEAIECDIGAHPRESRRVIEALIARIREREDPKATDYPRAAFARGVRHGLSTGAQTTEIGVLEVIRAGWKQDCEIRAKLAIPSRMDADTSGLPNVDLIHVMQAAAIEAKFSNRISFFHLDTFAKAIRKALQSPINPPNPPELTAKPREVWVKFFPDPEATNVDQLSMSKPKYSIGWSRMREIPSGEIQS